MIHTFIGDLGHVFVILSFVSALIAAFSYFKASSSTDFSLEKQWRINGRTAFSIHTISILGIVLCLFSIIYNHYFEYHYAWSHSSTKLPTHYMISCFWEGQEGSFLLWLFWHAILGMVLIFTSRQWENKVMTIVSLVQAFLASMILGVVIPLVNFKIGSTPFILLRDALDAPIFTMQPNFIPEDGNGLNPLLQNYWMVIHPPVLFLGFASTLVPFAFCLAGLWAGKYKEWIKPTLPWTLFSAAILGLGILMGGYWAYETLNFGGYWNWDPVENAVYVPWIILVSSIHAMIIYSNSKAALKTSIILVISTFILILYATFLTRSGILGNASVHSFTDLGLSGQLLIYLLFFTLIAAIIAKVRWKHIPTTDKEASTYSREFWVFIGITILCLMGFQVLLPTSIPVYNALVESFGFVSNVAPPADQIGFYTKFQLWFAIAIALLSGTAQFFWWKKMDKVTLINSLKTPIILTLLLTALIIAFTGISNPAYMLLLICSIYSIVANGSILIKTLKINPKLSGGSIAHIGVALMLIGILASSGYSKVVSLNNTGLLISKEADAEFNNENLLLFLNEPRTMAGYDITYRGDFIEDREYGIFINKNDFHTTNDEYEVVSKTNISKEGFDYYQEYDTIEIVPENTYYKIEYLDSDSNLFTLYPRAQVNEAMGLLASPDIKRSLGKDLYTHVSSIPNPDEEKEWTEMEETEVGVNTNFFVNDYVATLINMDRVKQVEGVELSPEDVAVKATIKVQGETRDYFIQPIFLIKNGLVGRIPDEIPDLGLKITVINIHPEKGTLSLGYNTTQKSWIVMKALEKPLINVLWIGTLILMFGFSIAIYRRYSEFKRA
jgi:cytochrome c-type biogenesis protein CcmF